MTPGTIRQQWRAVGHALLYLVVGGGLIAFSFIGKRPWTGVATLLALTWLFQAHLARRPWREMGFPFHPRGLVEWCAGAVFGAALFSLVVGTMAAVGTVAFHQGGGGPFPQEIVTVLGVLALVEELLTRGYPLLTLAHAFGPTRALVATSLIFALLHGANPGFGVLPCLGTLFGGVVMGAIFLRWQSLWAAWGFHFAWNAVQGLVYGLPVSGVSAQALNTPSLLTAQVHGPSWWTGGNFGPEASISAIVLLGLLAAGLIRWPGGSSLEAVWRERTAEGPDLVIQQVDGGDDF